MTWDPCRKHEWVQLADGASYRCAKCGAAGYRKQVHNPFTRQQILAEHVLLYKCPGCHRATKSPKSKCPTCAKKCKDVWEPTLLQKEVLAQLGEDDAPMHVPASGATLGVLRKKGLIKQVQLWQITKKGEEFLTGNSSNQEEENG